MKINLPVHCVTSEDGKKVHDLILAGILQGKQIQLSFEGVEDLTFVFLHTAIGQLYGKLSDQQIREHLIVVGASPIDLHTIKRTVDKAKEYYSNKVITL